MRCTPRSLLGLALILAALATPTLGQSSRESDSPRVAIAKAYRWTPLLNRDGLDAFHRIFETTPEQREAVELLLQAEEIESRAALKEAGEIGAEFLSQPTRLRTPGITEHTRERIRSVAPSVPVRWDRMQENLRALLTAEQEARWWRLETFRRRYRVFYYGSGSRFDPSNILALAEHAGISAKDHPIAGDLLELYDKRLDVILQQLQSPPPTDPRLPDTEQSFARMNYLTNRQRDIAQLNAEFLRRIASAVPREPAETLRMLHTRASLPDTWGPQLTDVAIRAAPELEDLNPAARESIKQIADAYVPRYEALRDELAADERVRRDPTQSRPPPSRPREDRPLYKRAILLQQTRDAIREHITPDQYNQLLRKAQQTRAEHSRRMIR